MSSNVKLVNQTKSNVLFGLWSAPNDYKTSKKVEGGGAEIVTLDHSDARVIGVWTGSNDLYPDNDNPYVTGAYFKDGMSYTVTLTSAGIKVS